MHDTASTYGWRDNNEVIQVHLPRVAEPLLAYSLAHKLDNLGLD